MERRCGDATGSTRSNSGPATAWSVKSATPRSGFVRLTEAAEARESEKRATSKVIIKRVERNKRKHVTEISGLEHFNIDLKKAAKEFGKKFATGSSVTKTASGGEEITVQGDVSDEVLEWVTEKYDVPEENVEQIEDRKKEKKAAPPMVAPQPT